MINNIELISQSALRIKYNDKVIYFDPYLLNNKYKNDADYIFITHSHYDHFSREDILSIKKDSTKIVIPYDLENDIIELGFIKINILVVKPDMEYNIDDITFNTVCAYNKLKPYHKPEYNWVGYVVKMDQIIYIAGDTDNIDEIRNIKCDIACVPIGGTYTMDVIEAVNLIKSIKPSIAIPIHYKTIVGTTEDAYEFKKLLNDICDVRILME